MPDYLVFILSFLFFGLCTTVTVYYFIDECYFKEDLKFIFLFFALFLTTLCWLVGSYKCLEYTKTECKIQNKYNQDGTFTQYCNGYNITKSYGIVYKEGQVVIVTKYDKWNNGIYFTGKSVLLEIKN